MAFNHEYPYTDAQLFNDDWLIMKVKELLAQFSEFVSLNTIKYSDPIEWDITRQYEKNTVVIDERTGNAYLSTQPVPKGVQIDNQTYWTVIFNYEETIHQLREQIATDEGNTTTATQPFAIGDLVFVYGKLYKVKSAIIAGNTFVVDSNIEKITIEELLAYHASLIAGLLSEVGDLDDLTCRVKTSIVNAINGVDTDRINGDAALSERVGALTDLTCRVTSSIVAAINGVDTDRINGDAALSARIDLFQNRRIIVVGDSYLYGSNVDGDERITGWGDYLKNYLGIADANFFKVDISGGGFVSDGANEHNWLLQLQARSGSITSHNTITDVVVFGGQNDKVVSAVTLAPAVASFCSYVKTEYPNARLHIGYCGVDYINMNTQHNAIATIPVYEDCVLSGASYIFGSEYVLRDTTLLQSDHCHPTEDGQKELAKYLVNYLSNNMNYGCKSLFKRQTPTFTAATGVSGAMTFHVLRNNGNTQIDAYHGVGFTLTSENQNWDGNHRIKLGTLADSALWGFSFSGADMANPTNMICPSLFVIGGAYYKGDLNLHIQAKTVYAAPFIQTIEGAYMSGVISTILPAKTSHTVVNSLLC